MPSLARQSALAAKAQSGDIAILDTVSFDAPKTKAYLAMLKALSLDTTKSLLITTRCAIKKLFKHDPILAHPINREA